MELLRPLVAPLSPAPVRPVALPGSTPPPAPPQAAAVTIGAIGPQEPGGGVPVGYATDKATDALAVLYPEASPKPLAGQFGGADPGYTDLGTISLPVGGSNIPLTLPDGLLGNYKIALLPTGGGDADVAESPVFALDTTAPALSGVTFSDDGAEGVNWAFTSDEAGTWRVSLWAQGTNPTAAEIASGTGALATVTGACTGGTAETGAFSALGAGTYQPTIWVGDNFGNETAQTYTDVTVAAASSAPHRNYITGHMTNAETFTLDLSAVSVGDELFIPMVIRLTQSTFDVTAMTIEGTAATLEASDPTGGGGSLSHFKVWRITATAAMAGNPAASVSVTRTSGGLYLSVGVYRITGTVTASALSSLHSQSSVSLNLTPAAGCLLAFGAAYQDTDPNFTSGVSRDYLSGTALDQAHAFGSADTAGGAVTVTFTQSDSAGGINLAVLEIS